MTNHSKIKSCPITGDENPIKYFDLGFIPLVNNLSDNRTDSINAERFPLNINYYESSHLSSLDFAVDSELLFSHYLFKSSINIPYYKHCQNMFISAQKFVSISNGSNIADIGGNDGTLLDAFRSISDKKLNLLNIDPSKNLAEISRSINIPVYNDFFNFDVSEKIKTKFDLIISTNVFQHLKDINSFAKGIENSLTTEGIWVLEFPYWIDDMMTNQFDQIYHEHMYYHSVNPMLLIMSKHGLKILNITKQDIHGGTLRLIISKINSKLNADNTIQDFIDYEKDYNKEYYINWGKKIQEHIENSKKFIKSLKEEGKTIFGFGAAAKGCIYLNAMGLTYEDIDCIIDDTDIKQGKFIPGTGIEVVSRDILVDNKPDYILILAHNFKDYIIKSLENIYDGKYIILIPNAKIL